VILSMLFLLLSGAKIDYGILRDQAVAVPLLGVGLTATYGQFGVPRAFATGEPSRVSVVATHAGHLRSRFRPPVLAAANRCRHNGWHLNGFRAGGMAA
jgi:hypothetical protein